MDLMTKYKTIYSEVNGDKLLQQVNTIAETAVADVIKIGRWKSSHETIRLDAAADIMQRKVMTGQCKLIYFKGALERWKAAGTNQAK
jgi:argininosuccinate synthase